MSKITRKMYVRYVGEGVCWTIMDETERFYVGSREELTEEERKVCDNGGGYMDLTTAVDAVAR